LKNAIALALFFAAFAILGAALYPHFQQPSRANNGAGNATALEAPKATLENGSVINHVFLLEGGALPDALAVKFGELVQFDARDGRQHVIAQGGGDEFNQSHSHQVYRVESGSFGPGEAYRVSFSRTGTFHFHDHQNPKIFVTVIVYLPDSNASNSTR